ncbi:MAG: TadE/TadG family type IV pilus assembly protein [Geminicoccaceae bacterium]
MSTNADPQKHGQPSRHRRARILPHPREVGQDERGVAALEFALVLPPFLLLLFALFELGLILIGDIVLHHAVVATAQAYRDDKSAPADLQSARSLVCANLSALLSCGSQLTLDIRPANRLDSNASKVIAADGFDRGNDGDLLVVRASYDWHGVTPINRLANLGTDASGHLVAGSLVRRSNDS